MGYRIGVVCEGSHDYYVLKEFTSLIIRESGELIDAFDCLQPTMSATFQVGGGGWPQVKAWCERNNGQGYRLYLDQPAFATSKPYDLLIVHLDGDVVSHCEAPPLSGLCADDLSVADTVSTLKGAILGHWLTVETEHRGRLVACVPVRHLEAWLSAVVGPKIVDHEVVDIKDAFRAGPAKRLKGEWRDRYIAAANLAVAEIGQVRSKCASYRVFEEDLKQAAGAL